MKILLFVVVIISGCAVHTSQNDAELQRIGDNFIGKSIESFLAINPDIKEPIPIGNGNMRYTYIHDVTTAGEFGNAVLFGVYSCVLYFYFLFNNDVIIYKPTSLEGLILDKTNNHNFHKVAGALLCVVRFHTYLFPIWQAQKICPVSYIKKEKQIKPVPTSATL